jgi:outer membrane protein assembly factor BamB
MKKSPIWKHVAAALAACMPIAVPASGCGQPPDDSDFRSLGDFGSLAKGPVAVLAEDAAPKNADGLIASPEPGWPQWRGSRRDGISAETDLLPTWPEDGPRRLWKTDRLGTGWSSPIVVEGRLYITGDVDDELVIFAFDLEGNLQWQTTNGASWKGSFPGARATCVYSEGRLYHMNAHGRVACLDAASGKELWAVDVLEKFQGRNITWAMSECLLVDGPRLIVTPGGEKALMAALDKRNGQTVWTTEPIRNDQATHSSPILFRHAGRRLLANCSSGHGFGVDADTGKLLWTVPLRNQYGVNVTPPVYGAGNIFYVTAYTPAVSYRLEADGDGLRAQRAWNCALDTVTGGAVLVDGLLYASGYSRSKWWFCFDWKTGRTRYQRKDLTTGAAILADGRLYCMAEDGRVALLKPEADRFELAGQFRLVPKRVSDAWVHPVLLDGRLYLRYHSTLGCYDVRAK